MDYDIIFRFLIALVFVLGLIGLLAWVARRFGLGGRVATRAGRKRRTMVVEATAVDAKRRLVLVRRDDVEHLILLGPTVDLVVEQGIPVPDEHDATPGSSQDNGRARDFGSELKARLGLAAPADGSSAALSSNQPPAPPALPAAKRRGARLSKTKLAQLKPERLRFGKQPGTKQ